MPLQASELRIGNWVQAGQLGYVQIAKVVPEEIERLSLHPIPLSEDVVERLGFEMDASLPVPSWNYNNNFLFFDKYGTDSYSVRLFDTFDIHLKYVHQLQNFFYLLTGEELKIDNL